MEAVFNLSTIWRSQTRANRVEISHDSLDSLVKTASKEKAVIIPICCITYHGLNTMISKTLNLSEYSREVKKLWLSRTS